VPDEYLIFERHTFTDETVARDFAAVSHARPFLNFYKCANLYIVSDLATIQIRKREDVDPLAKLHVRRNPLIELFGIVHADTIARPPAGTTTP